MALDWSYPAKDIIDGAVTQVFKGGKHWGKSNQSIFVGYCITMGSSFPHAPLNDYIEAFRDKDIGRFNEMMDKIEKLVDAFTHGTDFRHHTYYYTIVDQYLSQSVKYIDGCSIADLSWRVSNNKKEDVEEFLKVVPPFLKSVIKKRDFYEKQINKIYDKMKYLLFDYLFNIDPKNISPPSKI